MRRLRYLLFVTRMVLVVAAVRMASILRRAVGARPVTHRYRRLLARHWPHVLRLRPVEQFTVGDFAPREGAGSRALMTIYAIAFCRRHGYSYRHTPMTRVAHAVGPQDAFDAAWESALGFGQDEVPAGSAGNPAVFDLWELLLDANAPGASLLDFADPPPDPLAAPYYTFIDPAADRPERDRQRAAFAALLDEVLPQMRARYWQRNPATERRAFTVAVHVRRGDVGPERDDMWTGTAAYAHTLEDVLAVLAGQGITAQVHVYSQGERGELAALEEMATQVACDGDPVATFRALVEADVLIMAKSCFSQLAALLSDGIAIYEPWQIPPSAGWLERGADGGIDRAAFAALLTGRRP